jgi:hypothetical protein
VSDRLTGREVGRLSAGSDYATAVAFRDILIESGDSLRPAEFLATYRLEPPDHIEPPHVNTGTEAEKRRVRSALVPVYAALFLLAEPLLD